MDEDEEVRLIIPKADLARAMELQEVLKAPSLADVFLGAITLCEVVCRTRFGGGQVLIHSLDGSTNELPLPAWPEAEPDVGPR
jgi:hypothetical protein